MSKYQAGDKVIVKKNLEFNKEYYMEGSHLYYYIDEDNKKYEGQIVTIDCISHDEESYDLIEDNGNNFWTDEMFEGLAEKVDKQVKEETNDKKDNITSENTNLKTYEMVALANENGKTYVNEDMKYNKELGFHDELNEEWKIESFYDYGLNYFINMDGWKELDKPKLTKEELVKLIGYDFDIVE